MNHYYPLLNPQGLHIPDGFLNFTISIIFWVLTIIFVGIAVRKTQAQFGERQVPLMGVMAAFIFAAQMINFPVAGGTSGHLLGGALAAIVLGPWAGMLVMTTVVGVQALVFQDGGLLVMGANIFNMGLVTALIGYGIHRAFQGRGRRAKLAAAGIAAWLSVVAGALLTAFQLWLSGISTIRVVFPAMLGIHALIGVGEALITVAALTFILQTRPDLLAETEPKGGRGWVVAGALVSLAVVILSPWASSDPDGLERVAIDLGFFNTGQESPFKLFQDYTIPFMGETTISTIVAGLIGTVLVAVLVIGLVGFLRRKHVEVES